MYALLDEVAFLMIDGANSIEDRNAAHGSRCRDAPRGYSRPPTGLINATREPRPLFLNISADRLTRQQRGIEREGGRSCSRDLLFVSVIIMR